MDPKYDHTKVESRIYKKWEKGHYFSSKIDKSKKPFSIILPLPNANDPMHMGHALFTVEDILIRYRRMKGNPTLWLPGGDHAGIETQFVFEKHLAKEGKSRFDFDRDTLYQMIWDFANKNKDLNKNQMKQLGFSLDWTRYHYSLEPEIVQRVVQTFIKLFEDGLVYRDERLVNYCTHCGTGLSDLEVNYVERKDPLYYLKYGPFVLATTRPETKFGDTAVAFHPGDKRYQKYLGQDIDIQGVNGLFTVKVIADKDIDPKFGTGIEKVTPAHDFLDFEIGKRHHLPFKKVIDINGRLTELAGRFANLKVNAARKAVTDEMEKMGLIDHIDEHYFHRVATCYKCGTTIEPLLIPQWYVATKKLAEPAIQAVRSGKTKIVPKKRFEKLYFDWLENILDWNISRQIVWGPQIPAWYKVDGNEQRIWVVFLTEQKEIKQGPIGQHYRNGYTLDQIKQGIQRVMVPIYEKKENQPEIFVGSTCPSNGNWIQETDTFDTWFLSGQWPVNTLKSKPGDFEYFYPTSVLDTLWDILFFWVARMMMLGLYLTDRVPFETIHLHARVVDEKGQKMSKSKGNVINPVEMVDKYGADALRMALTISVAPASDIVISDDKVRAMRNFTNKIWNIARFILSAESKNEVKSKQNDNLQNLIQQTVKATTKDLDNFKFGIASERLYQVIWHDFADIYIEDYKKGLLSYSVLESSFEILLKLLHPFMPFITEEIWSLMPRDEKTPLIISPWPTSK